LGHAYLSTGAETTRLIVVCWHPLPTKIRIMSEINDPVM
jgi:hypothetical protein